MRICYANDGTSIYDHLFIKFLIKKGHDVHLITFHPLLMSDETEEEIPAFEGLKVHHFDVQKILGANNRNGLRGFFKLALKHVIHISGLSSLLRRIKPDVLNGHFIPTYGLWSALSYYHPFLLMSWGSDMLVLPKQFRTGKLVTRFVLKMADAVIVPSTVLKQTAVDFGCDSRKIVSFPWAVDLDRFNPKVSGERIRKSLGWEENPIIFCTRWHSPIYGVKYLLHAVPEIIREHANARFMLGGCGPRTDEFKDFVAKRDLKKFVKFVGKIPHEEMPEYMAACDIYVSPSFSDGTSASLLEAMACSKPVVVSDVPGNLEWIANNENGFIVPKADIGALAKANLELLRDEGLRKEFGARNLEIVKKRADLRRSLQIYEDTLMMLASEKNRHTNLSNLS